MAKNSVRDFDATAANNTDIQSVDIAENCAPSGINNAIRELMADIKNVSTGTIALESPSADSLTVTGDLTVDTNTLYVDSTNNRVGVGTTSPTQVMTVKTATDANFIMLNDSGVRLQATNDAGTSLDTLKVAGSPLIFLGSGGAETARIDSSGNLLVGKTSTTFNTQGSYITSGGILGVTRAGGESGSFNRTGSDGTIMGFYRDGAVVGSIGSVSGAYIFIGSDSVQQTYIGFNNNYVYPSNNAGGFKDNAIDLGNASARFDDVYATNGTIQTSDQNEKQQIASLTTAEITAAKAISKLFKTFKWNDKVEAKSDAARTHAGVIAQEVQQAMSDAGLNAADYAFWCSDTWWESGDEFYKTQAEAPEGAVERTRLGIRYPELLAFVGAATEQRLADIETRLTTLENA